MRKFFALTGSVLALGIAAPALAVTAGTTTFTVKITNVSQDDTLKVSGGNPVKAPIAPGVFLVDRETSVFEPGMVASSELEALAEDGNFEPLQNALHAKYGGQAGMFAPGLEFTITARPGDQFSFATMFVQSNDKFYAPSMGAIDLFDAAGKPISGDRTSSVRLFDAGTELDQQPGAGAHQAPRQKMADQGPEQNGVVAQAADGFDYPEVANVIRVEIRPSE